ncbi:hypothetical protein [Actinoallomurus sp. NPDC052274]|uniref:hypothetical protein n=1 Tax=Actinoallomurus sp. NPDC052274 TaxID=3155420 RepID=UPI00341494C3
MPASRRLPAKLAGDATFLALGAIATTTAALIATGERVSLAARTAAAVTAGAAVGVALGIRARSDA